MDEQTLYKLMKGGVPSRKEILRALNECINDGRTLEWFQTVIPELRPGEQSDEEWVEEAREMLWEDDDWKVHSRRMALQQPDSKPLPDDRYGLRKYWPLIMETLRPLSPELLVLGNAVFEVVARRECLSETQNHTRTTHQEDQKHRQFVVAAQAIQGKILTPIIDDILLKPHRRVIQNKIEKLEGDMKEPAQASTRAYFVGMVAPELDDNEEVSAVTERLKPSASTLQPTPAKKASIRDYFVSMASPELDGNAGVSAVAERLKPSASTVQSTPAKKASISDHFVSMASPELDDNAGVSAVADHLKPSASTLQPTPAKKKSSQTHKSKRTSQHASFDVGDEDEKELSKKSAPNRPVWPEAAIEEELERLRSEAARLQNSSKEKEQDELLVALTKFRRQLVVEKELENGTHLRKRKSPYDIQRDPREITRTRY